LQVLTYVLLLCMQALDGIDGLCNSPVAAAQASEAQVPASNMTLPWLLGAMLEAWPFAAPHCTSILHKIKAHGPAAAGGAVLEALKDKEAPGVLRGVVGLLLARNPEVEVAAAELLLFAAERVRAGSPHT
jgi:hypothetical protein